MDDPVNRADVWGLWSLFGGADDTEKPTPGSDSDSKPYFCKWAKCDDNGTMQGDYKPIEGRDGVPPFLIQYHFMDPLVWPFMSHYERNMEKQ